MVYPSQMTQVEIHFQKDQWNFEISPVFNIFIETHGWFWETFKGQRALFFSILLNTPFLFSVHSSCVVLYQRSLNSWMLLGSQGQPPALLIKDQQFISFFCHGHLFQLKRAAHCPRTALCYIDKMVSKSTIRVQFRNPFSVLSFEEMESALMICVPPPLSLSQ